ncbi:hypothetical protein [Psychromonas antarctica]|uniref:hypothetical protein n=1 Tax=Psychromonas antarctica TaxID=67573 RepID=UPI001EE95EE4|nr:hypothetical protein [Psychromonas antarctica]MCG6200541.1 hypothetical protein [Psychromonas antarctica]
MRERIGALTSIAMEIYNTHQFLVAFCGGIWGRLSYKLLASSGWFLCLAGLML